MVKKLRLFLLLYTLSTAIAFGSNNIVPVDKPEIKINEDGSVTILNTTKRTITKSTNKNTNKSDETLPITNSSHKNTDDNKTNITNKINITKDANKIPAKNIEDNANNKSTKPDKVETAKQNNKQDDKSDKKNNSINDNINNKTDKKQQLTIDKIIENNIENIENKTENIDSNGNLSNNNSDKNKDYKNDANTNITTNKIDLDNVNNIEYDVGYAKLNDNKKKHLKKIVKNSNYTANSNNLNLINKIERNLMYSNANPHKKTGDKIDIKKGTWTRDDLVEVKEDKKFEITTKSSKNVGINVQNSEKDKKISALKDKAFEAFNLKEYEIAIKLYRQILSLNKNDNFTKLSLATTYHILGQYVQAKQLYIELLPIFPNSEQLISNLLSIIIQESPYEAIYLLPALANKYNNSAIIQAQTSVAFSTVERYNEAIKYILNAISLDDENIEYKYNLAVLYDTTKQYDKAYRIYKNISDYSKNNTISSIPINNINDRMKKIRRYL